MIELIEFQFDLIADELLVWKITLEWFHDGWKSAVKKFLDIALVGIKRGV